MKTVLITGTSSGIGQSFLEEFGNDPGIKILAGLKTQYEAETAKQYSQVQYFVLDYGNHQDFKKLEDYLLRNNYTIDTLIANAGVSTWGPMLEINEDTFEQIFKINFFGTTKLIKTVLPFLATQGKIIAMGSGSATTTIPFMGIYPISKLAIDYLITSLRREMAHHPTYYQVQFAIIHPGSIKTPIWEGAKELSFKTDFPFYAKVASFGLKTIDADLSKSTNPIQVAKLFHQLILKRKIKSTYYIGRNINVIRFLNLLPHRMVDFIFKWGFKLGLNYKNSTSKRD
ncbi:SDR family NAD(P)-dependent oxidoreductase [Legionella sp. D16C41]|uniref:SDR family NAD(P)-dependent oxidoreductase n=1 Tax=Legionella sp. D16C41 TaxID=3402688 RepID=UPI003AF96D54